MLKWLLVLVLGLYLAIVGLVTFVGLDSIKHSHDSARNTIALCALRDNIKVNISERIEQIERSEKYLADHPKGAPGIPPSLVLQGIKANRTALHQSQRSFAALRVLHCD